jgi:hypothetical protein
MNPNSAEAEERKAALAAELVGESERACAIVGAAWVEEALQQAIESVFHPHQEARDKLFTGTGALTAFEAKIELACVLGFMTESIRKDLHAIRRIRNDFAHAIAHRATQAKLSFESDDIRKRCLALRVVKHLQPTDPRIAFTQACGALNFDFSNIAFMSSKVPDSGRVFAIGVD